MAEIDKTAIEKEIVETKAKMFDMQQHVNQLNEQYRQLVDKLRNLDTKLKQTKEG